MENKLIRNSVSAVVVVVMVMSIFALPVAIGGNDAYGDTGEMKMETSSLTSMGLSESEIGKNIKQELSVNAQDRSVKSTNNVQFLVTGSEKIATATLTPTLLSAPTNRYGCIQTVTLPTKGTLLLSAGSVEKYVTFGLFYDAALNNPVDSTYSSSANTKDYKYFKVPEAGTYHIGVYYTDSASSIVPILMSAAFVNGADRTIYSGKQVAVGTREAQNTYFKFKATSTGYLQVLTEKNLYAGIYLYNSKKKALSSKTSSSYAPTYGVKKGSTYYVRINSPSNYKNGGYIFKVTNKKITEKSGKKRSKAVTIKKGKTKKGTIIAGSKQADWYKAKLKSKKKMTITLKGATNDKLKITIYDKKGKKISGGERTYSYYDAKLVLKSYSKFPKGTYYIKISRANSKSSGWYSIKWK